MKKLFYKTFLIFTAILTLHLSACGLAGNCDKIWCEQNKAECLNKFTLVTYPDPSHGSIIHKSLGGDVIIFDLSTAPSPTVLNQKSQTEPYILAYIFQQQTGEQLALTLVRKDDDTFIASIPSNTVHPNGMEVFRNGKAQFIIERGIPSKKQDPQTLEMKDSMESISITKSVELK